jgi:hypothetical protein
MPFAKHSDDKMTFEIHLIYMFYQLRELYTYDMSHNLFGLIHSSSWIIEMHSLRLQKGLTATYDLIQVLKQTRCA